MFAGVSVIALAVATPEVGAADMPAAPPIIAKAKPRVCAPITTMYIEGAAFQSSGDRLFTPTSEFGEGFEIPGIGIKPKWGWEAAAGIDYQFACSPWHVSIDVRYGEAKRKRSGSFYNETVSGLFISSGVGRIRHKETHWAADFMVGRDIGIGTGKSQLKVGLRVANLEAKTRAFGSIYYSAASYASANVRQTSKFLGFGPRVALEGSIPFVQKGPLAIDYSVGAAALWGERKLKMRAFVSSFCCGTDVINFSSNKDGVIPNVDASVALAYLISPNAKLSVGYRFDGYWNVFKTFNSSGGVVNADRFFHGPFARLTGEF